MAGKPPERCKPAANLFIAVPAYQGVVSTETCAALIQTVMALKKAGMMVQTQFLNGSCYIDSTPSPQVVAAGGLLSPPQVTDPLTGMTPQQQSSADAMNRFLAGLKDAAAYLQHQPEAAGNVAAFENQRQQRMHDAIGQSNYNNLLLGMIPKPPPSPVQLFPYGLPPAAAAWLLLQRLRNNGSAAAQNQAPAPPEAGKETQPAPTLPMSGADNGWSVERVQ